MREIKQVPQNIIDAIEAHDHFIIIGHMNPDSDSINSQLALASLLQYLGKETLLASAGPFTRQEIASLESQFHAHIPRKYKSLDPLVLVVDCSSPDRIGYLSEEIAGLTVGVIDHHAAGQGFGDITYIDPTAFSVTYLILQMYHAYAAPISQTDAHRMLFGLATDTGYFRHVGEYRGEVFLTISELVEAGASPRVIYQEMYGKRTFESRKLIGLLLGRMEQYFDGRMLVTWETCEETLHYGEVNRDSETLYAQMLGVNECEVILFVRQNDDENTCTVGFRAHGESPINVGAIAADFGGGGHKKAAGATMEGDIHDVIDTLIGRFTPFLS